MASRKMKYKEIKVGMRFSFKRVITPEDGEIFSELTGDFNPLHLDKKFAQKSQFGKNIVHGMLAGSLFSALIVVHCPGRSSLYLSQTLNFKQPIFYGDQLRVVGQVKNKSEPLKIITLKTEILRGNEAVVTGEAKVKLLD